MSIFGKAWRVVKSARHALAVFVDVGVALRSIVRGDLGRAIDKAKTIDDAIEAGEKAVEKRD